MTDKTITLTEAELDAKIDEATKGLKDKNAELLGEVKKLKKGSAVDPAEVEKLEGQIDDLKTKLAESDKANKKITKELETITGKLQAESGFTEKLLKQNGLAAELAKNGVTNPALLEAAQALLGSQVQIVADGENRVAKVGDKTLDAYVKEWAGSDKGKHFVTATGNSGGGANGSASKGDGSKTATRAQFDGMDHMSRATFAKEGGKVVD